MNRDQDNDDWIPDPEQMKDQGMALSAGSALERRLLELLQQATEERLNTQSKQSASTTQQSSTKEA
jgi:hypothetical protein